MHRLGVLQLANIELGAQNEALQQQLAIAKATIEELHVKLAETGHLLHPLKGASSRSSNKIPTERSTSARRVFASRSEPRLWSIASGVPISNAPPKRGKVLTLSRELIAVS